MREINTITVSPDHILRTNSLLIQFFLIKHGIPADQKDSLCDRRLRVCGIFACEIVARGGLCSEHHSQGPRLVLLVPFSWLALCFRSCEDLGDIWRVLFWRFFSFLFFFIFFPFAKLPGPDGRMGKSIEPMKMVSLHLKFGLIWVLYSGQRSRSPFVLCPVVCRGYQQAPWFISYGYVYSGTCQNLYYTITM